MFSGRSFKSHFQQSVNHFTVPAHRRLIECIKRLVQFPNYRSVLLISKARSLFHKDFFYNVTMKGDSANIHLMNHIEFRSSNCKYDSDIFLSDVWTKCFIIFHSFNLTEALSYQSCLSNGPSGPDLIVKTQRHLTALLLAGNSNKRKVLFSTIAANLFRHTFLHLGSSTPKILVVAAAKPVNKQKITDFSSTASRAAFVYLF